jgi:hypothetical protein
MKKIVGYAQVIHHNPKEFTNGVDEWISKLQNDNQEVEVHYSTNVVNNTIMYTALIFGRKNVE